MTSLLNPSSPGPARQSGEYRAALAKVRELGHQLSEALAETGDSEYALVRPAGVADAVGFGRCKDLLPQIVEAPVDTLARLTSRLSFALDDWNKQTGWPCVAHVHPASSGRGVWYENVSRSKRESDELAALVTRCSAALAAFDATHEDVISSAAHPVNAEMDASRRALLDYKPSSAAGLRDKARAMLSLRCFAEWDDLDRAALILAFAGEGV